MREAAGQNDHVHLAQVDPSSEEEIRLTLLTQIARALGLQRKFDEAHQVSAEFVSSNI